MREILSHLFENNTLASDEACNILIDIGNGKYSPIQVTAFMTVFQMRSITVEELAGFRNALLRLCISIDLSSYNPIDLCGTGGDGKDTFNISTLASFIAAGAGVLVAKHGNYGISSTCGSSNVMEFFGYQFTIDPQKLEEQMEQAGICFLHAPYFHPAMKHVAPIRKELAVKTFFNILGPMVNPSRPLYQVIGVYSLELARMYNYLYQQNGTRFVILHSLDGYDEISLTGPFKMISNDTEELRTPEDLGLQQCQASALNAGTSIKESAKIFEKVLTGQGTETQNAIVCANAGIAIRCTKPQLSIIDAIALAQESLMTGAALKSFKSLLAV